MKELSIEEKAKRYDEAIERAKEFKEHLLEINDKGYADEMDYIFPELKESEDERIRKGLIQYFKDFTLDTFAGLDPKKILAWLEKQGEQAPTWSEEDETMATNIIIMLKEGASLHFNKNDIAKGVDWLKSLKDRVQPKQEWSVDDERTYRSILYDFERHFPLNCVQQEFVKSHIQPHNRWEPSEG